MDHNPFLKPSTGHSSDPPQKGSIERADTPNLVWQSRAAPPAEYESRLGDALEAAFGEGIESLEGVVARLNALGVPRPDGELWDEASFVAEMRRLGE